jgi:starch phosphorylase
MPELPSRIGDLGVLAADLWWSWHLEAWSLFAELSPALWKESGENPVRLLLRLPQSTLAAAAPTPRSAAGTTW